MTPAEYLESVIDHLSEVSIISSSRIIREYSNPNKAHLRARLTFVDNSYLEFYEYIERGGNGEINVKTYSYHWAGENNELIRRWDNTPHFPKSENFPHHIHIGENEVMPGAPINIFAILDEIAKIITE